MLQIEKPDVSFVQIYALKSAEFYKLFVSA